ncbi:hypothetical protein FDV58_35020 [Bradyrhizobium elkanii]|uniref:Uncharacterized protein n=1 Tax=Bradyrhizobium elkanii TaxID=29448 RepID=A0A4U6RIJ0_BRAEL|nr:hypothetical protein [Bradyrhizobium elkanii]TKV73871.1 hypothetical protein FDV58_35020 [Bradyrhizobium elkanii]
MADTDRASRVHHEAFQDYVTGRVCKLISRAAELLRVPAPDTFIGRKTREPFPPRRRSNSPIGALLLLLLNESMDDLLKPADQLMLGRRRSVQLKLAK